MSRRKIAIAAGVLILAGGAVAIAAVGHREARMGHRGSMNEMGDADSGFGEARGRRRPITAEDFDARMRERFARIDKNSDGILDASEIEAAITAGPEGRGRFRDRVRQRFGGTANTNADTKVSRQEALDRATRDFRRVDLNGDGRITDADLPPMLRDRGVLKGERAGRGGMMGAGMRLDALIAADANQDGIVTLDEVLAHAGKQFDLADRNKDGVVDKTDRDALIKETTDYRVRRFLHANGAAPDGKLTREQFFKNAKERFAELDANQDGRVDRHDRGRERGPGGRGDGQRGEGQRGDGMRGDGMRGDGGMRDPGSRDRGPPR